MQVRRQTMGPWSCLWLLAVVMLETTAAYSDFCQKPANMEICWFNKINKRFLRFGRGDPFLRFGKRASDLEGLEDMENGYLHLGRSLSQPSLLDILALEGAQYRKRRDVREVQDEAPELRRTKRDVQDGGFLRFGRGGDDSDVDAIKGQDAEGSMKQAPGKRADPYLRFGRDGASQFPRWGKRYLRFGRAGSEGFLRFGKRLS